MLKVAFSSPSVKAYTIGRQETFPADITSFPVVTMQQTHSNNVCIVNSTQTKVTENCDAIITPLTGLLLQVRHADCLPVLLFHPSGVIAAVHAGRKGTEQKIVLKVLKKLQSHFAIQDSLEIWFGPAICKECYQIERTKDVHYDLSAENTRQIRSLFTESEAIIQYSCHCTAHENETFYSYRKHGKGVPMNWSGIIQL